MKKSLLLILVLIVYGIIKMDAQIAPGIEWEKSIGGSGYDDASSIQQTTDGGFITAGSSSSNDVDISGNHGSSDFLVLKLASTGTVEWQKSLGGISDEFGSSIQLTTDGGYIVAGYSKSNSGDVTGHHGTTAKFDYWVVKLDSVGIIQWQKSLGGTLDEFGNSVQQTADGGFVVAGYSLSNDGDITGHHGGAGTADYWIVKLSASGTLTWQKSLGGSNIDHANSIQLTNDGGFIVAGASNSNDGDVSGNHGSFDFWIVKLDSTGTITWQKSLGGSDDDEAYSIQQTTDGGYVAAGFSKSNNGDASGNHGSFDYWVVKLDSTGTLSWQKSLGGTGADQANSVEQTADNGYVIAGYAFSYGGDVSGFHGGGYWGDDWIVRLNNAGTLIWQKCLGGTNDDVATSALEIVDGEYIIAGWSTSTNGDVTVNNGLTDAWIVQLSMPTAIDQPDNLTFESSVFPNPAANLITLKLQNRDITYSGATSDKATITINNVLGEKLFEKTSVFTNGNLDEEIFLDNHFTPGMYLIKVSSGQQYWEKPLMVAK